MTPVVGWMVLEAVVDCMGPRGPVVGWMEMGELVAGRVLQNAILQVVMHSTTMAAGVPLVHQRPIRRLVH